MLDRLLTEYPASNAAPGATYYQCISRYRANRDAGELKTAYLTLQLPVPAKRLDFPG